MSDILQANMSNRIAFAQLDAAKKRVAELIGGGMPANEALETILCAQAAAYVLVLSEFDMFPPGVDAKKVAHEMIDIVWGLERLAPEEKS